MTTTLRRGLGFVARSFNGRTRPFGGWYECSNHSRVAKIREAATKEQMQVQALAELKELGVVPANLEPATLDALSAKFYADLTTKVTDLDQTVTSAEQLVTGTALSMD